MLAFAFRSQILIPSSHLNMIPKSSPQLLTLVTPSVSFGFGSNLRKLKGHKDFWDEMTLVSSV